MSSGFVSEKVLEEKRRQRQEEWEKVRQPHEPEKAPEPEHESRSLFDQLQANRAKTQEEWDEAHKLKNQIRGIDDDEADFLDEVDAVKSNMERQRWKEEQKALEEYRKGQAELMEREVEARMRSEVARVPAVAAAAVATATTAATAKGATAKQSSQSKLLLGAVKRKATATATATATAESEEKKEATEAKKRVVEETKRTIGALAGLGEYSSSDEEEDDEKEKRS